MGSDSNNCEFEIIAKYFAPLSLGHKAALGLTDDIAFIDGEILKKGLVVSSDTIVENVHFRTNDPIETIASKIVRVNKSDIIAKGCRPIAAFLNLTWPVNRSSQELELFAQQLGRELENIPLLGGDTTSSPNTLVISLSIFAEPINRVPILRRGAKENDIIFVTNTIGSAYLGLMALESGNPKGFKAEIEHYQMPKIPPEETADLIASFATASLDVSDGLLGDLKKLAIESSILVEVFIDKVPISEAAKNHIQSTNDETQELFKLLSFGDDYQSVFCASPSNRELIMQMAAENSIHLSEIGVCAKGSGLKVSKNDEAIALDAPLSYSHNFS